MKKIILMILICLMLTGCCHTSGFNKEAATKCIPYCNGYGMDYTPESTVVCANTIECACVAPPSMRLRK